MSGRDQQLRALEHAGMLRKLRPLSGRSGAWIKDGQQSLLNLSSNDYLGLASDADLLAEFYQDMGAENRVDDYGIGVASSRLLTGDTLIAHQLEQELSALYGCESALLFNSGYHANIGILPALYAKHDLIFSDKLNHASIHDGCRRDCRCLHRDPLLSSSLCLQTVGGQICQIRTCF